MWGPQIGGRHAPKHARIWGMRSPPVYGTAVPGEPRPEKQVTQNEEFLYVEVQPPPRKQV